MGQIFISIKKDLRVKIMGPGMKDPYWIDFSVQKGFWEAKNAMEGKILTERSKLLKDVVSVDIDVLRDVLSKSWPTTTTISQAKPSVPGKGTFGKRKDM